LGPLYVKQLLKMPNLSPELEARIKAKHAEFRAYFRVSQIEEMFKYGDEGQHFQTQVHSIYPMVGIGCAFGCKRTLT
uniref:SECA_MOTOR_DEAD domain-containing protein n=1 Tax=Echinostoma caproni TaxID=27848 RepID=A0A183B9T0_9TREM